MGSRPAVRRHAISAAVLALCVIASGVGPAAAAPAHRVLSKAQVHRIIRFTGYQGLHSHRFDLAGEFRAGAAVFKVIRLDGATLPVSLSEIRHDVEQAESIAQGGGTFSSTLKVGPGRKQQISYRVSPSATMPGSVRYIIFAPRKEQLDSLTTPVRVPSIQALTLVHGQERLTVTLLHDRSRQATWEGTKIPYAALCTLIESINATNRITVAPSTLRRLARQHVNLSYLTDPNHPNPTRRRELTNLGGRGFEIWSNSLGFAITSAQSGVPYQRYARRLTRMGFSYYVQNQMHFLRLPAPVYGQFAQTG